MGRLCGPGRLLPGRRDSSKSRSVAARFADAHLATVGSREKRAELIEDEIRRTYQAEQALEKWARCGAGNPPTPFSAIELATINLELSKRLAAMREQVGALMAAE